MKTRILQVVHNLRVAGTEMLAARLAERFRPEYETAVCCLDEKGDLAAGLIEQGISVYCLDRHPGIDWNAVAAMKRVYESFKPDIVHAHQYTPFFYAALAKRKGMKLLFSEHGRHYPDAVGLGRRLANLWLQRRADWVGAVCEFSKSRLRDLEGFRRREIEVIYNGVAVEGVDYGDPQRTRLELGIPPEARVVGFAGGLRPVKNPGLLLQAFEKLHRKFEDLHLLYVGDGFLRKALEEEARGKNLNACVTFAGTRHPVHPYLKAMDLFVLPSLSEGASLTLLEAMAAGVPVLATDVGGNRELIEAEVSGMLVASRDAAAMAEKIARLMMNPEGLLEMARRGRERVRERFSREKMMESYGRLYEKMR